MIEMNMGFSAAVRSLASVCLFSLLLLPCSTSAIFPHQQRRFLGRGVPLKPSLHTYSQVPDGPPYKVKHAVQKLDHFNATDTRNFSQRYLVLDIHWDKKGPIFVYTGNEGDIIWFFENTGFLVKDLSQHFNALVIFIEHRYYGYSLPFGAASYKDAQHLAYLTSEQALADFAAVIQEVKSGYNTTSPAIAVGGSYGGMLAAWLRMQYPNVVIGSLAASAPIWWFPDLTPCNRGYQTITRDFNDVPLHNSGITCSGIISKVWGQIDNLVKQAPVGGSKLLTEVFNLCFPLNSTETDNLISWLEETWFNLAMVDYPYDANFLEPLPPWPVNVSCSSIYQYFQHIPKLLDAVAAGVNVYYNSTGQTKCYSITQTATSKLGTRGWDYQACTEMVMPMCSNGVYDMFSKHDWNLTAYEEGCMQQFGVKPQPDLIKKLYGGKDIGGHSNIIFSNGVLDPWSGGGVLESVSDSLVAIVLQKGAHHLDLRASQSNDPPELVQARQIEIDIMTGWIKDYNSQH